MNRELLAIFEMMERERGISRDALITVVESALLVSGRRSIGAVRDLKVKVDPTTFDIRAFASIQVVDFVRNKQQQISVEEAQVRFPGSQLGDLIEIEVTPSNFGRIAAQTAKQAIIQKLRMVEKDKVLNTYKNQQGSLITGTIRRFDRGDILVDLGDSEGVLPSKERVASEDYSMGDRMRFLLLQVNQLSQGTQLVLSRAHPDFVRKLFETEVAEIADGTVQIKAIAREAGYRTKIAVHAVEEKIDPVGACVGLRGQRVKNIVRELAGEKVDITKWSNDIKTFVTHALAPAKLISITENELERQVRVIVERDQFSLAIGKHGQNARLTSRLTGWRVDIKREDVNATFQEKVKAAIAQLVDIPGIGSERAKSLVDAGFLTLEGILSADVADLLDIEGFTAEMADEVRAAAEKANAELEAAAKEKAEAEALEKAAAAEKPAAPENAPAKGKNKNKNKGKAEAKVEAEVVAESAAEVAAEAVASDEEPPPPPQFADAPNAPDTPTPEDKGAAD